MRRPIPQYIACFLALTAFLPASAQELPEEEVEELEIRRYTVEVIVFRYTQEASTGSEVFFADEPVIEELLLDSDLEEDPIEVQELVAELEEEPEPWPDAELVLMAEEDYQLDEALEHLRRLDVYEPLMHFGWTQATWPEEQTEAIPLFRFEQPPEGLDGNLTLYLSRYLHLVVDLQLEAPETVQFDVHEQERLGDTRTITRTDGGLFDEVNATPSTFFRIQENRILKNGELRYYDHPKFGVLAMVTRVEEEEEDPDTGELLGYGPE